MLFAINFAVFNTKEKQVFFIITVIITPKQSVIPTDTAINKQEVTQVPQHRMPRSNTKLLHVSITKIDCLLNDIHLK